MIKMQWSMGLLASVCQEITGFPAFDIASRCGMPSYLQSNDEGSWTMGYLFVRNHESAEGARFKRFVATTKYDNSLTYLSEFGRQSPGEFTGELDSDVWCQMLHECRAEGIWIQTEQVWPFTCLDAIRKLLSQEDA